MGRADRTAQTGLCRVNRKCRWEQPAFEFWTRENLIKKIFSIYVSEHAQSESIGRKV